MSGGELNTRETIVKIRVLGAGGGGSNAVNRMVEDEVQNVDFIVVDTNAISASKSKARNIIQIGENEAKGIGAGANPEVKENVNALIVIENDKLLKSNSENITIINAFKQADNTLKQGIVGITNLLNTVGEINIDFADISTIIGIKGLAYMGIGSSNGEKALETATRKAIDNPLTSVKINGAKGIIINIQGSKDLSLTEINSSVSIINDIVNPDANIIFGTVIDEELGDEVIVTVIATGVDETY